jgi:hypothetical protein
MFARLWWKEARQTWPAWGFLAVVGMAIQSFCHWSKSVSPDGYAYVGLVVTMMYLFMIAAAVFAGERENGTLWILDAMPAGRLRVWVAKASFALATTLALGIFLWLTSLAFVGGYSRGWAQSGGVVLVVGLPALGWALLWSAVLRNALHAAVLAMVSLSLTAVFVNLNQAPGVREALLLLGVAALTTGASAWLFRVSGPPRWEPRRRRPAAHAVAAPGVPDEVATVRNPRAVWPATVPRLWWETLRQVRTDLWMLVGLAIASAITPQLMALNQSRNETVSLTILGAAILGLVTGVLTFNGENRGRTHRFLLHHGARPRVVWAVKVATWWAASLGLWSIALAALWLTMPAYPLHELPATIGLASLAAWVISGLTIPFAIAVVCGMAFQRGIVAGTISLVATLAVLILLYSVSVARVMFPWYWPYLAAGALSVSWGWSGDWLRDAPGWKRWARLAIYAVAPASILAPVYIADRVWAVPQLPPRAAEAFFQRSRVVAPVAEKDNAAPVYREAYGIISQTTYPTPNREAGKPPAWAADLRYVDQASFDPDLAGATEWLTRLEPALAKLRDGARRPACRYVDLRTATEFDQADEPPIHALILPLAVSARVRLARGELDEAWVDVETLVRLGRQYSYGSRWSWLMVDPVAAGLVLRWATDPRQTVATLEKAARAWKAIPPGASAAERARIDAAVFHNTLALPKDALIDRLVYGSPDIRRRANPLQKLQSEIQTTPWELARAGKVFDLLAAARIQRFEKPAHAFIPSRHGMPVEQWRSFSELVDPGWGLLVLENTRTVSLSPEELSSLAISTPLVDYASTSLNFRQLGRSQMVQRAIWLVLLLRLHQARHDGKLPGSLEALKAPIETGALESSRAQTGEDQDLTATAEDLADPYSDKRFGYVESHGQNLLPMGAVEALYSTYSSQSETRMKPAVGCRLLYSVGEDGVDDRAERNVGIDSKGDFIFPLKDDVKPPAARPR